MSEFDKEKERKRLEEKYERDKEKREATERMSELLLQGATMTNAHCSECGDPIFRYDGQEFCATCERPIERAQSNETDGADAGDGIEVTTPSDDARVQFGDRGDVDSTHTANAATADPGQTQTEPESTPTDSTPTKSSRTESTPTESTPPPQQSQTGDVPIQQPQTGGESIQQPQTGDESMQQRHAGGQQRDIETARQSLTRTLVAFSQRAEATDDPKRAREHLKAAREAAETLKTLR